MNLNHAVGMGIQVFLFSNDHRLVDHLQSGIIHAVSDVKIMRAYRACAHELMMKCTCFVDKGHSEDFCDHNTDNIRHWR